MPFVNRLKRIAILALVCAYPIAAQVEQAAITGAITDQSDARIAHAKVAVTNVRTGISSTTVTNSEGYYSIPYLAPGEYTVAVESSGFKKSVVSGIALRVGFT